MMLRTAQLLKETILGWSRSDAAMHAAAIAYYTLFSLAPLLILSVSIASRMFDQSLVESRVVSGLQQQFGDAAATVAQDVMVYSHGVSSGWVATGLGILFLLYGASVVFLQLQASLNAMWNIQRRSDTVSNSLVAILKSRLLSAIFVLAIGYLLLIAIFLSALWATLSRETVRQYMGQQLAQLVPLARVWASPLLFTVVFAIVFKVLPQATVRWRDILPGAALTALLFWVGNYLLGLYLARSLWSSVYGAAGSVIVFLLWVYYSAWILLFGAKFIHEYAARYGTPIRPYPYMTYQGGGNPDTSVSIPAG